MISRLVKKIIYFLKVSTKNPIYKILHAIKNFDFKLIFIILKYFFFKFLDKNTLKILIDNDKKKKLFFKLDNFITFEYLFPEKDVPEKLILNFIFNYFKLNSGTYFDVGSMIGLHSIVAAIASDNSKIHAFEANKDLMEILKNNIKNNIKRKLTINECFVTNSKLYKKNVNNEIYENYSNKIIRLDKYIKKNKINLIDVMKIDVEGAELQVLDGLKNFNLNNVNFFLIEIHPEKIRNHFKDNPERIFSIFKERSFNLYFLDHRKIKQPIESYNDSTKKKYLDLDNFLLLVSKIKKKQIMIYFKKVTWKKYNLI